MKKLEMDFLSVPQCREVFEKYSGEIVTESEKPDLDEVIKLAGRHTLAIELLARIYASSPNYQQINDLNKDLEKKDFHLTERIIRNRDSEYREFLEHFRRLFDISGICNDQEKMHILKIFSIIGSAEAPRDKVFQWIGKDYQKAYKELVNGNWLSEKNHMVSMHDLISEALRRQAPPEYNDCQYMIEQMTNAIKLR